MQVETGEENSEPEVKLRCISTLFVQYVPFL